MNTIYFNFLSLKKPLDGYQFPVFQTESCPRNEIEWTGRSSVLNCTKSNGYMCMPSENFTTLLEFCYSQDKLVVENGKKKKRMKLKNVSLYIWTYVWIRIHVIKVKNLFLAIYMLNELAFIILDKGISYYNFSGSKFEISVFLLFLFYFLLISVFNSDCH